MSLLIYLGLGAAMMYLVMFFLQDRYKIKPGKLLMFDLLLTVCGVAGVKLMYFVENGSFAGLSFFGAVLITPLLLIPVALLLKERVPAVLDLSAPAICAMLGVMKIQCVVEGCCRGRMMDLFGLLLPFRFPSQLVELANACVLVVVLVCLARKKANYGHIYPLFLVLYGITRFVWNLFREAEPFIGPLPIGNFWSLISLIIGLIWLFALKKKKA